MQPVTIYTKPLCPYCTRAVSLLKKKGAEINDISAAFDKEKREEMLQRSNGARTYPQIFIGDVHVGGCDDMMALERDGKLDQLLKGDAA
ncbi:glutaredoxin 3 [Parvularcula flava]|uniref:Glutaredoxin n=1 Tax=Aquisalinus luteolus TaxID=1566827 RepID=A0A8J3A2J5_9PROT|nr:glutaredoxin 3 [Aquisalinus luteolus]NHK27451.1 glutaredoxin 3 [Aquisalinus luteolus]GGH95480.1 glutaredoxin 3 [Aquisalinus luteolus]